MKTSLKVKVENPSLLDSFEDSISLKKWLENANHENINSINQPREVLKDDEAGGLPGSELIIEVISNPEVISSVIAGVFSLITTWLEIRAKKNTKVEVKDEEDKIVSTESKSN